MEQESKLRLFFQLLKGQKLKFILAMVAVAVTSLVGLLPQQVIRFTVDAVIGGEAFPLPGYLQGIYDLLGGPVHISKQPVALRRTYAADLPGQQRLFLFAGPAGQLRQ